MPVDRKSLEPWLRDEIKFYDHQLEGVRWMIRRPNLLLCDDMGLGKSLQTIAAFATDVKMGWGETAIVVAPVSLKDNWANEFDKFTRIPYVVFGQRVNSKGRVVSMTRNERIAQIVEFALNQSGPRVLIVNYEQVVAHLEELNVVNFHLAVFDEAHALGSPESKRTKACLMLKALRKFLLTGSPVTHHVQNLWAMMRMTVPGTPGYPTFMNRHAAYGGFQNRQIVGIKRKDEIHEALASVMLRRLKDDVLDLPPVNVIPVYVGLTDEQQKLYDEVVNEMQLTTAFDPDNPMEVENALTKMLRLKQICGSTFAFTGEDHSYKLDEVVAKTLELIDNGHKVVVFTQFRDTLALYVERLAKARKGQIPVWQLSGDVAPSDRFEAVENWSNDKRAGVMACMIQVAAVGLNMTAARHGIFIDKTYVPMINRQAIDRMHRIGQGTQPVMVWEFIVRNTVEERIEQICNQKVQVHGELIEEIRWKSELVREIYKDPLPTPMVPVPRGQMSIGDIADSLSRSGSN